MVYTTYNVQPGNTGGVWWCSTLTLSRTEHQYCLCAIVVSYIVPYGQLMMLSLEERVFLSEHVFCESWKYTEEVKTQFAMQFPNNAVPHRNAGRQLASMFREMGSVTDASRSGWPTLLMVDKLDEMSDEMFCSPSKPIQSLSQETNVLFTKLYVRNWNCTRTEF